MLNMALSVTFSLDMVIILKTIYKVFRRDDIVVVDQSKLKDLDVERSDKCGN